eukprot:CAMPEP_0168195360 /NCGR_PEP_ID=MMETSP0139_2-20121125/19795_1 /TAXON_ID=44445 /ORGANISM="Pseudo-nitzschia australis, Strain 10249 10 AB" /LENGTH=85 /DNA_ID=CAMNT_0008119171 /DNA_START=162 /DNA_END=415 /DNA_ORIENTATION=+
MSSFGFMNANVVAPDSVSAPVPAPAVSSFSFLNSPAVISEQQASSSSDIVPSDAVPAGSTASATSGFSFMAQEPTTTTTTTTTTT